MYLFVFLNKNKFTEYKQKNKIMNSDSLFAVSPVDGRYRKQTEGLRMYFSEFALIKYRFHVEVEYFIALTNILPQLSFFKDHVLLRELRSKVEMFDEADAERVKAIEKITNHDVKAVELFMRELMPDYPQKEFIHFALTSFDTDGMARPLMLKASHEDILLPLLFRLIGVLKDGVHQWWDIPMLAHTHGQPASPTLLGKEINVFVERLESQIKLLQTIPWSAKFGGANGNLNAHYLAYPHIDWHAFADQFVSGLGLVRTQTTTQIEPGDNLAAYCHAWERINTILIDFVRDMWTYIMLEYFKQKLKDTETGSSTMPHKINPIDFENGEGNLGLANAMLNHFAAKLPISRLQRDLSDSTVIRNMGVPLGHMLIAYNSILKGIGKVEVNISKINEDLDNNWAVVSEAYQTILRREMYPNAYDVLKDLTRTGEKITKDVLHAFVDSLRVNQSIKDELKAITPWTYTGVVQ